MVYLVILFDELALEAQRLVVDIRVLFRERLLRWINRYFVRFEWGLTVGYGLRGWASE